MKELAGGIPDSPVSITGGVQAKTPKQGPPGPDTESSYDPIEFAKVLQQQKLQEDKTEFLQDFMGRMREKDAKPAKANTIDVLGLLQQAYQPQELMQ